MQQSLLFKDAPETGASMFPKVDYDFPADRDNWCGLVLVGEAPGADEARLGHPFVGRSGQLLNKILERASIDRRKCLVANVFRFQPPGNKIDHFFISKRKADDEGIGIETRYGKFGSLWCREEFSKEINYLEEVLRKIRPKVIVSLGRTALWALTGENGLMEKIGKNQPCQLISGVPVIPTYHPSFILRGNWGLQDTWLTHLLQAKQYIN